jgi:hypothetical protein
MTAETFNLTDHVQVRVLRLSDAARMTEAYQLNRDHLAPWEPERTDEFFTADAQSKVIAAKRVLYAAGSEATSKSLVRGRTTSCSSASSTDANQIPPGTRRTIPAPGAAAAVVLSGTLIRRSRRQRETSPAQLLFHDTPLH